MSRRTWLHMGAQKSIAKSLRTKQVKFEFNAVPMFLKIRFDLTRSDPYRIYRQLYFVIYACSLMGCVYVTSSNSQTQNLRVIKGFILIRHKTKEVLNLYLFTTCQLNSVFRLETRAKCADPRTPRHNSIFEIFLGGSLIAPKY